MKYYDLYVALGVLKQPSPPLARVLSTLQLPCTKRLSGKSSKEIETLAFTCIRAKNQKTNAAISLPMKTGPERVRNHIAELQMANAAIWGEL